MPGIRIYHKELRGTTYVVEHPTRRYKIPYLCSLCKTTHEKKTYHIELDGVGNAIVSKEVFQRLREAGMPGLHLENEVKNPPPQRVAIHKPGQNLRGEFSVRRAQVEGSGQLFVLKNRLRLPRKPGKAQDG